jgi:hypothetical protein
MEGGRKKELSKAIILLFYFIEFRASCLLGRSSAI